MTESNNVVAIETAFSEKVTCKKLCFRYNSRRLGGINSFYTYILNIYFFFKRAVMKE